MSPGLGWLRRVPRLLTADRRVADALAVCTRAGTDLGAYWRSGKRHEDNTERLWTAHKEALEAFIVAAGGKFAGVRLAKTDGRRWDPPTAPQQ